jgi:site-specific DNA-adenine methylase
MFYYYGRKKQIVRRYPSPNCDTIVEPFAGSAAYSLHGENWKKRVVLVEKDEKVAAIWQWLIERATIKDVSALPELKVRQKTSEFLHIIHAATKMAFYFKTIKVTPVLARNWEISRRHMAENLHKIKHWKIICGDYTQAPDVKATWFIDPPYKGASGHGYRHGSKQLNYERLAQWALSRSGEIVFCEGAEADYLPFHPLVEQKGVAGKVSQEVIFYRSSVAPLQMPLFAHHGALQAVS